MSKVLNVSIDFTQLMLLAKTAPVHSAFTRGKNGHAYLAIAVWENDATDEYGNDVAVQLHSKKEKREAEGVVYIGNGRTPEAQKAAREKRQVETSASPIDDLPF